MTINGTTPKPVKLTATVETITPEVAGRLLGTMDRNRAQRRAKINQFARAMLAGEWQLNGEPVIIGHNGKVIDGQHRLQAVMTAKVPIMMLVVRGVMPESMATIDTGTSRSYGDVTTLRGDGSYGPQLAAVARRWWIYENTPGGETFGAAFRVQLSHTEIDHIIEQHPMIRESVIRAQNSRFKKYLPASAFGFAHNYMAEKIDPEIAELFFSTLEHGAELTERNPLLVLRNRLIEADRLTAVERLALTIKAYNMWIEGHTIKVLSWNKNEDFPRFGVTTAAMRAHRRRQMKAEGEPVDPRPSRIPDAEKKRIAEESRTRAVEETKAALAANHASH